MRTKAPGQVWRSGFGRLVVIATLVVPAVASAAQYQARVRWMPGGTEPVAGYRIYQRTLGGVYGEPIDAGLPAPATDGTFDHVWPNLDTALGYAFVVTAYLTDGTESLASNELELDPIVNEPPPPPTTTSSTS